MRDYDIFDRDSKDVVDELEEERNSGGKSGKLFKIVNTITILGMFAALGIGVLGIFQVLKFNAPTFGVIGTIISICVGSWLMLPWVACLDQKKHKKASLTFIILDVAIPLLWIFAIWFFVIRITGGGVGVKTLTFIKVVFLISLQFAVVSFVANTVLRYGKKLIVVQIVAYISYAYFDFYLSYALFCIRFTEAEGIVFSGALEVLGNKLLVALFVLAFVYIIISFSIINGRHKKRRRRLGDTVMDLVPGSERRTQTQASAPAPAEPKKDITEEQLQALQNLLDKNLITQEEYEEKRKAIINRM